jgi:DNA-binding NtrC family response regulator
VNSAANRLLVVDNEEVALAALRDLLRQQGYAVATAQNAAQAAAILQQQQFAAVLADQQLPMLTGVEFLAEVKRVQPDACRILMASSLTLGAVIEAVNKVEIFRFVHKPWRQEELLFLARNAVEHYETTTRSKLLLTTAMAMNETLTKLNQSLEKQLAQERNQAGYSQGDV